MSCSLKTGFLTIVLSAIALVAIAQSTRQIEFSEAATLSTGGGVMSSPEANVQELSVDEQRIEQLSQGSDDAFARGICSVTCAPCNSSSQCPPFQGQAQYCSIGTQCP
jgi:hypothetical protein